jgi:hypothetical protein
LIFGSGINHNFPHFFNELRMKNCIVTFCHRLRLWIKKTLRLRFRLVRQGRPREGQAQAFLHRLRLWIKKTLRLRFRLVG